MRIIGGRLRGRSLTGPRSNAIRPTSDRLRESIFDILMHAYADPVVDARALDLFAGVGALGIEALSRGAAFTAFVDSSEESQSIVRANLRGLGLAPAAVFLRKDATRLGVLSDGPAYSLAFLDPPYGAGLVRPTLESLRAGAWLARGALVVVEESRKSHLEPPEGFDLCGSRVYGDTQIAFLRWVAD